MKNRAMGKRIIKSHKGGRSAEFHIRIRPEIKKQIFEMAESQGVSTADLIEEWSNEKYKNKQK